MNTLEPLTAKINTKNIFSFDIETEGDKNNFIMGSILGDGWHKVFWNKKEMGDFFIDNYRRFNNSYITATNLQFDLLGLFSHTKHIKNILPIISGSNMIFCNIPIDYHKSGAIKRGLKFIDTFNFAPFSVAKWGNMLNIPKLPKPKCFMRKPENDEEREELEKYNIRDSLITFKAFEFLQDNFNKLGCNLKITVASTSMDLFKRKYLKEKLYQPDLRLINYLYNAYFGGRTEVFKRGYIQNLNYYDVNSLYPHAMRRIYPHPNSVLYSKHINKNTIRDYEGVCKVRVKAPNLYAPYLPFKTQNKLLFPKGVFEGYYTFFELRKALELGYQILKIYDGILYTKTFHPFKEYVEDLYKLRKEYKNKGDPTELIFKLGLNSLYGKWAQKIDNKQEIIHRDNITSKHIRNSNSFIRAGEFFYFNKKCNHVPKFINPIFSIYTTAYARDILYKYIQKAKDVYYVDTDSLITPHSFDDSKKLGELKLEYKIKEGVIVKPKMYMFNENVRCKGVRGMNRDKFYNILAGKIVRIPKLSKFKESNKRGLEYNQKMIVDKIISLEDNKRQWEYKFNPDALQDSKPVTI